MNNSDGDTPTMGKIPFILILFCALIILCVFVFYYMCSNVQKQKEDYALRIIVFQMIAATLIQNISRIIIFFILHYFKEMSHNACIITECFIETTTATIPLLFSSYILVYFKSIFPSSIIILSITQLNILLVITNWILPCAYWITAILVTEGLNTKQFCMYMNTNVLIIHNVCCLFMNGVGVVIGSLMKWKLSSKGKNMETETKNKLSFYLVMNIIYSGLFVGKMFMLAFDNGETPKNPSGKGSENLWFVIYQTVDNISFCLIPAVFFAVFCFECKCIKIKHLKDEYIPNDLDSSFGNKLVIDKEDNDL